MWQSGKEKKGNTLKQWRDKRRTRCKGGLDVLCMPWDSLLVRERREICACRPPLLLTEKYQLQTQPLVPGTRLHRLPASLWWRCPDVLQVAGREDSETKQAFIPCPSEVFSQSHPSVWIRRANTHCIFCLETQSLCLQNTSLARCRVTPVSISRLLNRDELPSSQVTFKAGRCRYGWESRAVKAGEQMLCLGESCSAFGLLPVMPSLCPDVTKKFEWVQF